MNFQFTHPWWLLSLLLVLPWAIGLTLRSYVQLNPWRKWTALILRLTIALTLVFALAGLQWLRPLEGMNVFFLLDRSDSISSTQQELARAYVNRAAAMKKPVDKAGVLVFGSEASIESSVNPIVELQKVHAVVGTERTDIAGAIRLGTAAFPEAGQKRLVLLSDGSENAGDALEAILAARTLGVTLDVLPLGGKHGHDVSVQKLGVPTSLKKGQTFEVKIFAQSDQSQPATVRLYRNEQLLGEQRVELSAGKNLFTFPQKLIEPGFYSYDVAVEAPGDTVPQNNRAAGFASVRGNPRILVVSAEPGPDAPLVAALRSADLDVKSVGLTGFPGTLAEMQSYDTVFLSNIAAGDLGDNLMKLIESAVRDFGIGLVCIGGDQTYAAGGYRGTPLEATLPVDMELNSKKTLPSGALVLVVHATEFPNGNQWARDIAFAALDALGPLDEMGIVLWDGSDRWLFPLTKVGDKRVLGQKITGMNPGDMPSFQHVMEMAHDGLKASHAHLKHMVVFSDGDPGPPSPSLMNAILGDKITVSTVMIGGHVEPDRMIMIAESGRGRFYDVRSPGQLPQIFIKEASVILKSAIYEEPFKPRLQTGNEVVRGIGPAEYPALLGYVATTPKPRAEVPLVTDKGDPLLAHWQYGLGRSVAFTSDAKAKWASQWLGWGKYRQFWSQVAQWSMRRVDTSDFNAEVTVDKGEGSITVEALDAQGNYRNFLSLQSIVVSPKGERQTVRLEQSGPGHYEGRFQTREVGAYLLNLMDMKDGQLRSSQVLGASVNYSPEFNVTEPNLSLLNRLVESGAGKILDPENPADNPFLHGRQKTFQPRDLWEWLIKLAIVLFPLDVAVRRVQLDRGEWSRATQTLRRSLLFWRRPKGPPEADESLTALLARREQVRATQTAPTDQPRADLFRPQKPQGDVRLPGPSLAVHLPAAPEETAEPPETKEPDSTTGRLLAAKRRAQKRKE